jgi:hypothetical protein
LDKKQNEESTRHLFQEDLFFLPVQWNRNNMPERLSINKGIITWANDGIYSGTYTSAPNPLSIDLDLIPNTAGRCRKRPSQSH